MVGPLATDATARGQDLVERWHSCHSWPGSGSGNLVPMKTSWLLQFWHQQLRLHQLYLDRHDVSGQDALRALAERKRAKGANR